MNNNSTAERGVLGTFNTSTYIDIGDPYLKKNQDLPRHRAKQFLTNPAHKTNSKDCYFANGLGNAHSWVSDGDKYLQQQQYLKTQPPANRKKGFLSSDAFRTDEFTNVMRTEQHRWALGREQAFVKLHQRNRPPPSSHGGDVLGAIPLGEAAPEYKTPQHLYDIGKGDYITKFSQRQHRENWFESNRNTNKPRRMGDYLPASYEIGNEAVQEANLHKPSYANTPIIQSTFYRVGSVAHNAGWAGLSRQTV